MRNIIQEARAFLRENADAKIRESAQRFFKEDIKCHGLKSADVQKIAKQLFKKLKNEPKDAILDLCEELWQSGYMEERGIACVWTQNLHKRFEPGDFKRFERWVDEYVKDWAACDTLCNHSLAAFVEMYPEYMAELKSWTASPNRWKKRAAAVTLIIPARRGKFLDDILEIAEKLLTDQDDMVQKGYGWMLKAASEAHPQEVFDYVMSKRDVMPRTAFRYSLEKVPAEWRKKAMSK